ncbi:MAG TPA: VIT1/CCC1 transporter family protein [Solirubrobacteraceae bacterium]|nr:VIT1/CCC1 transporter family protein [Solirubrobacteraceae bacterium]
MSQPGTETPGSEPGHRAETSNTAPTKTRPGARSPVPQPASADAEGPGDTDAREAIFGSFDGMTSTLGVVAGLLATNATAPKILAAAIGIAVAATVGMGAGQYLSDGNRNVRKAVVMAVATLIGSVLPAIPFIFGDSKACVLSSIGITILAAGVIGHYRGYAVTYLILIVVSVITVGLSIAVA